MSRSVREVSRSGSGPGPTPRSSSLTNEDLDLRNWVRSTLSLARTLGPMGSVRSGHRSERARTDPRTVYEYMREKLARASGYCQGLSKSVRLSPRVNSYRECKSTLNE